MVRLQFIHNTTRGDIQWKYAGDGDLKQNDVIDIETSRGVIQLANKPCEIKLETCDDPQFTYTLSVIVKEAHKPRPIHCCRCLNCTMYRSLSRSESILMENMWVRMDKSNSDHMELYDPIQKTWITWVNFVKLPESIGAWVLSKMKEGEAQPDREFHEAERESVEKTFGEMESEIPCKKDPVK